MRTSSKLSLAALSLLAVTVLVFAACAKEKIAPTYATGVKVDCGGKQTLKASGSTAQANAMTRFVKAYEKACPGQTLTYTSNGSGAGVSEFLRRRNRFRWLRLAASRRRVQQGQGAVRLGCLESAGRVRPFGDHLQPLSRRQAGARRPDAGEDLQRQDHPMGRPRDQGAQREEMPSEPIDVVFRSDASGTTDNFQRYLDAASNGAWGKGTGKVFNGGVGQGAPGNEGTSAKVKNTEGAITYNEYSFAQGQRLFAARIVTSAGPDPVAINADTVGKAIAGATIAGQGNNLVLDISSFYKPTQPGAYPIVLATYELVCSKYADAQTATAVRAFLQSTVGPGQADLEDHGYFPLPNQFQPKVLSAVNAIS